VKRAPRSKVAQASSRNVPARKLPGPACTRRALCQCDNCIVVRAREHIDGDIACGRGWSCMCGACRIARDIERTPRGKGAWPAGLEIDERFARLKRLDDARLARRAAGEGA
jgi:hypothetical protein